jgi:predicted nucleic acid-binding Zn ribbon protein
MKAVTPRLIGGAIASTLDQLGLDKKVKQYEVLDVWKEIVGEQIAQVTTADYFSGGKLFIRVSRSTWRNELTFLKQQLIEKVNTAMGEEIVHDIIFR